MNNQCQIINKENYLDIFTLSNIKNKKISQTLNCYIDRKLFISLITRKNYNWNLSIGGSLIMFERFPNKFIPDIPFSLNFFSAK